jgi:DnaJ-class molecular chaperone
MADVFTIYQICPNCHGAGEISTTATTPEPDDYESGTTLMSCPKCNGLGEVEWGRMEEVI